MSQTITQVAVGNLKSKSQPESIMTENFFIIKSFGDSYVIKSIQTSPSWYGDGHYREFVDGHANALDRARELSRIIYGV